MRFELTTSSMPFKKYQSLTDTSTRNKRLSKREFGRQWTPRGYFWASGLHTDSRTPHQNWRLTCSLTRDCRQLSNVCGNQAVQTERRLAEPGTRAMMGKTPELSNRLRCEDGGQRFTALLLAASLPRWQVAPESVA